MELLFLDAHELGLAGVRPGRGKGTFRGVLYTIFEQMRYSGKGIAGMLDGHAEQWGWDEFNDMRHWSDKADSADWQLEPNLP